MRAMTTENTHRRYTVRPTAVPMRAALNAVETMDPASVLRRLGAGRSICTLRVSVMVIVDQARVWTKSIYTARERLQRVCGAVLVVVCNNEA